MFKLSKKAHKFKELMMLEVNADKTTANINNISVRASCFNSPIKILKLPSRNSKKLQMKHLMEQIRKRTNVYEEKKLPTLPSGLVLPNLLVEHCMTSYKHDCIQHFYINL